MPLSLLSYVKQKWFMSVMASTPWRCACNIFTRSVHYVLHYDSVRMIWLKKAAMQMETLLVPISIASYIATLSMNITSLANNTKT